MGASCWPCRVGTGSFVPGRQLCWKGEKGAVHHLCCRLAGVLLGGVVDVQEDPGQMLGPVERVLEAPVGPLDHAVALRVVRGGGVVVHADDIAEPRPQRGGELGALVGGEVGRNAEAGHPLADEGVRQVSVSMLVRGTASSILLDLSMMVNR